MAGKDDDDPKSVKTNASPVLKPPGFGLGGQAPSGAVGTEKIWVEQVYLSGFGENPLRQGRQSEPTLETAPQQDKTTPRFAETDDPEVNRHYGQDHIMVRDDGSEMRPGDWDRESDKDAALDKFHSEEGVKDHGDDAALDKFHGSEAPGKGAGHDDGIRPQLWEDQNKRDDDDGIDR